MHTNAGSRVGYRTNLIGSDGVFPQVGDDPEARLPTPVATSGDPAVDIFLSMYSRIR